FTLHSLAIIHHSARTTTSCLPFISSIIIICAPPPSAIPHTPFHHLIPPHLICPKFSFSPVCVVPLLPPPAPPLGLTQSCHPTETAASRSSVPGSAIRCVCSNCNSSSCSCSRLHRR